MKKSNFIKNSKVLVILILILNACEGIFVPDPIDPRIPKYTEDGNNVAGAFINDNIWESIVSLNYDRPFINVWPENDSLLLRFSGKTAGVPSSIEFHLTGWKISDFEDLAKLEGSKIQLDGMKNAGFYTEGYDLFNYENKGIGQIYFKNIRIRVYNANGEGQISKTAIISGTFGFAMNDSGGKITKVTSGRFDYRIREDFNFQKE